MPMRRIDRDDRLSVGRPGARTPRKAATRKFSAVASISTFSPKCSGSVGTTARAGLEALMKLLTRRRVLVEEEGSTYMADNEGDPDEACALRPSQAAACTYRIAFGPRAGQKMPPLQGAMPRAVDFKQGLCADTRGFSLHAAVRCAADDRQALEQLCRYISSPPPSQRSTKPSCTTGSSRMTRQCAVSCSQGQ